MKRIALYLLPFFAKSMTVYYFVLLPPLLAQHFIDAAAVGYIGALSIGSLVLGAAIMSQLLHQRSSKKIVQLGAAIALGSAGILYAGIAGHNIWVIALSFATSGFEVGLSMSGANAIVAANTDRGNRYQILGRMSMIGDMSRILFPILVAIAISLDGLTLAVWIIAIMSILFLLVANSAPDSVSASTSSSLPVQHKLRTNRLFRFFLGLEFLDSFASSQLFVFVPILFIAKGYSLQNSLLLQTAIFLGYLSGRWLVSEVANRINGVSAVVFAEVGMSISIAMLLLTSNLILLYILTWMLGIFARGTSPVIKALAFDSLQEHQMKRGSAVHVIAGDSGSALGQLAFGLLLAWFGVKVPFVVAGLLGFGIALLATVYVKRRTSFLSQVNRA